MTPPKRLPTNPAFPASRPDPEATPPVGTSIAEVIEFRVKRLEDTTTATSGKLDAQRDRFDEKFDEVNASILKLTEQVAGTSACVEGLSGTVAQAMELVTARELGAIQVQTVERTVTIQDSADAAKTRRAFAVKVLAILGTVATAIAGAIAAGRC